MNSSTVVAGGIGVLAGGVAGWFLGTKLAGGRSSQELPLGEFLGILGGIGGGVLGAALVTPTPTPSAGTVADNTSNAGGLTQIPPAGA